MKHWEGIKKGRLAIAGATLAVAIAGGTVFSGISHAAYTICRTDPIVTLSNGAQITMYADIQANASDIKSVIYQLHGPAGTSVVGISYDQYGYLESVKFFAGGAAGRYKTLTTVVTSDGQDPFTANANVGGISCNQPPKSTSGLSGETVTMAFSC